MEPKKPRPVSFETWRTEISAEVVLLKQQVAALKQAREASPADAQLLKIAKAAYVALVHHAIGEPPTDDYIRTRLLYYTGLINKSESESEMAKRLAEMIEEMSAYRKTHK